MSLYSGMYRKGRLSVKRKNECRKRRAVLQSLAVARDPLPISIPRQVMSVFPLSFSSAVFLDARVTSKDHLKGRLKAVSFLPKGL